MSNFKETISQHFNHADEFELDTIIDLENENKKETISQHFNHADEFENNNNNNNEVKK
jgi:predicted Fe-Mo cluster-binding NifX family protein